MGEMADYLIETGMRQEWGDCFYPTREYRERKNIISIYSDNSTYPVQNLVKAAEKFISMDFIESPAIIGIVRFYGEKGYLTKRQREVVIEAIADAELKLDSQMRCD